MPAVGILIRLAITAVALWIATLVFSGITLGGGRTVVKIATLVGVAIIFGIVNAVLRPIIKTLGCGLYVLTLGLFALVVNGALFMLVSYLSGKLGLAFHVDHFWPTAVFGALLVGIVSWALNAVVPDKGNRDD